MKHFDAIIIGTGQAGPPLAARFSDAGKTVAVIERHKFGGTCVNTGCIPTKTLVASAYAAHVARRGAEYGFVISGDVLFQGSIGRTDLPGGDFTILEESIKTKLYTLPADTVVYSGHGDTTTIGDEMKGNPFVKMI